MPGARDPNSSPSMSSYRLLSSGQASRSATVKRGSILAAMRLPQFKVSMCRWSKSSTSSGVRIRKESCKLRWYARRCRARVRTPPAYFTNTLAKSLALIVLPGSVWLCAREDARRRRAYRYTFNTTASVQFLCSKSSESVRRSGPVSPNHKRRTGTCRHHVPSRGQ